MKLRPEYVLKAVEKLADRVKYLQIKFPYGNKLAQMALAPKGSYHAGTRVPTKAALARLEKVFTRATHPRWYPVSVGEMAYRLYRHTNTGKWVSNYKGWDWEKKGLAILKQFPEFRTKGDYIGKKGKWKPLHIPPEFEGEDYPYEDDAPEDYDDFFNPWATTEDLTGEEQDALAKYHAGIRDLKKQRPDINDREARRIVRETPEDVQNEYLERAFTKLGTKIMKK